VELLNQINSLLHIDALVCSLFSRNNIPDEALVSLVGEKWALSTNGFNGMALGCIRTYMFLESAVWDVSQNIELR
jgi:hypothetical protein